jgi:hypothetical protein
MNNNASGYGSYVADAAPQIHSKLLELRRAVGSLAAKKQQGGPMFPVRGAKELNQKLAQALNDLDLVAPVVAQSVQFIDTDKIPGNQTASGKPVFRTLVHVTATVRVIAPDGSYIDFVGSGHGGDTDDKAGGKASTYAWKDAILKGLSIPHEDMVDTDDDEGSATVSSPGKPAPVRNPKSDASTSTSSSAASSSTASPAADVGPGGLTYVLEKITQAQNNKSMQELEAIKEAIAKGTLALAGADRLRASKAWVEAKTAIEKG